MKERNGGGENKRPLKDHIASNQELYRDWFLEQIIMFAPGEFTPRALEELVDAFNFAYKAHRRTSPRDERIPYITHPTEATLLLVRYGVRDLDVLKGEMDHDVGEDSDILAKRSIRYKKRIELIKKKLAKKFNPTVAGIVAAVTKPRDEDVEGKTVAERKERATEEEFARLVESPDPRLVAQILLVKAGDRLQNLLTLLFVSPRRREITLKETEEILIPLIIEHNVVQYFPEIRAIISQMDAFMEIGWRSIGIGKSPRYSLLVSDNPSERAAGK